MRLAIGALALAACAGTAPAQCNIYRYGVPDFDQRRTYLDANGSVHCVPTSILNWMGYIANHGQPQALNHASSNWAGMNEYPFVNVRLHNMGGWMDTDTPNGTTLADGVDGAVDYMNHYNVGPAMVIGYRADDDWQPTPKTMYSFMQLGFMVGMCYGRYQLDGDQWERDGGHCVTLCAVQDGCNSNNARLGFKDPNTNPDTDPMTTQSTFKTKWWDVSKQTRNYDGDFYPMWGPAGQASGPNDTIRMIDTLFVVLPLFVLTQDANGALLQHSLQLLNNSEQPAMQLVNLPGGASLVHAAVHPRSINPILIGKIPGTTSSQVYDYNPVDRTFNPVLLLPATPGAFTLDRRGDLLLEINGDLHKYRYAADGSVSLLATARLGMPIQSLSCDDATDDIYALAPGRLLRFPGGDLSLLPYNGPISTGVPIGANPCVGFNPADGKPWVCSEGSPLLYQLTPGAAAPGWSISRTVNGGNGAKPIGLQFGDRGEMKFISGNAVREFAIDPSSGLYVPSGDPHFAGLPARGFLTLARSRTNFNPRTDVGPAWAPLQNPDPDTTEVVDCPADFNGDGYVDGIDYDQFNNLFEAGNINADVNFDGFVDGIDSDSFNNWFENGC